MKAAAAKLGPRQTDSPSKTHTPRFNGYRDILETALLLELITAPYIDRCWDSFDLILPSRLPGRLRDDGQMWCGGCVEEEHPI